MKVALAAQVFSRRTSIAMKSLSLTPDAKQTADLLEFFNNVFDFFNSGSSIEVGTRRPALRQLWDKQRKVKYSFLDCYSYCVLKLTIYNKYK